MRPAPLPCVCFPQVVRFRHPWGFRFLSWLQATLGFGRLVRPFHLVLSFYILGTFSPDLRDLYPRSGMTSPWRSGICFFAVLFNAARLMPVRPRPGPASTCYADNLPPGVSSGMPATADISRARGRMAARSRNRLAPAESQSGVERKRWMAVRMTDIISTRFCKFPDPFSPEPLWHF